MIEDFFKGQKAELAAIRHDIHQHPELAFEEYRTSQLVAQELARLGIKVTTGMAGTAVIGTLTNGTGGRTIGIRADMDALPIHETTNLPYASKSQGLMHACGHDGHTTILLGLARYLAARRNFNGTVHLVFQPAEEDISGAKRLVDEGLFKRFPCDMIFGMHNLPGNAPGQVTVRSGPITAAVDIVFVTVRGVGGHGALPQLAVDPIPAASSIVLALQTVVSRNVHPLDNAVVTVGAFNSGNNPTIIPGEAQLQIGVRTCTREVRELMRKRIPEIIQHQAKSFGCEADIDYGHGISYPAGFNAESATKLVRDVALGMGQKPADVDINGPYLFSEDFAFFQEAVPGCFFGVGNGDSRNLHDAGYDFNDELLVKGPVIWAKLVEEYLKPA